jgi:hypothetical protein
MQYTQKKGACQAFFLNHSSLLSALLSLSPAVPVHSIVKSSSQKKTSPRMKKTELIQKLNHQGAGGHLAEDFVHTTGLFTGFVV